MRNITVALTVSLIVAGCGGGGSSSGTTSTASTTGSQQPANSPVISFTVSRPEINSTQTSQLSWTVTNATSCTGSNAWTGSQPLTGSKSVSYNEGSQTFELSCSGSGGTSTKTVVVKGNTPSLSFAGEWYPVATQSLKDGYQGSVVGSFYELIRIGTQQKYGLAVTGWGFKGWDSRSKESAIVNIGLFEPDEKGLLNLVTKKYISDPETFGGASVIVTNLNDDKYQDIVLISHNETPIVANPSIVYYGSENGSFTKRQNADKMAAHDATTVTVDNKEKVLPSIVDANPKPGYYNFVSGNLTPVYTPNLSNYNSHFWQYGNMSGTLVQNTQGKKSIVTAGGCRLPSQSCGDRTINIFNFDGYDIPFAPPQQIITPYLSTLEKYSNVVSMDGKGQTHVYRVWSMDLNHDGNTDILAAQSMWHQDSNSYPVALQVLLNKGDNTFVDKTTTLNPDMPTDQNNIDSTPVFMDIDNSGIQTMFFTKITYNDTSKHSNYVMLNDGTGKLYVALHDEFVDISNNVFNLLTDKGYKFPISKPNKNWMLPAFIAVPQNDGSINFLAEVTTKHTNPNNGLNQVVHLFVNVPFSYNPTIDYIKNVNVADRNNSKRIRTWAGDDIISDVNANNGTKIDGGLGKNKVTYSGPSTNYNVVKNNDGSYRVTSSTNNIDDTLTRIHNIVFTDKTITLE